MSDESTEPVVALAISRLKTALLAERSVGGGFRGELSSSALATAVAVTALVVVDRKSHRAALERGAAWLRQTVNADGGWGDTPVSPSNLSTSTLVWSALNLAEGREAPSVEPHGRWIEHEIGGLEPARLSRAVAAVYGRDQTFSAPILTMAALAGAFGAGPEAWRLVPQLPFELAVVPQRLLSWLRLPVVSYALPALIAIGLVRHRRLPSRWPWLRRLRDGVTAIALRKLASVQPRSGGFLEAVPLTAFVAMSLAACGLSRSRAVERSSAFLRATQRPDGSWPIDSDLATWVTTLAVKALDAAGADLGAAREALVAWLLAQQHLRPHPFTQAASGGFAWTDLSGGVPDADDTAGALVALHVLDPAGAATRRAAHHAVLWLCDLQNRDGGVPTFCRGFGRLAFDRSSSDITAHAVQALTSWLPTLRAAEARRVRRFVRRAQRFLARSQRSDGAWLPLWFGNPWQPGGTNPVYGTAQVLLALGSVSGLSEDMRRRCERAASWLVGAQNADGGFGRDAQGGSTIEETGLVLAALAGRAPRETEERAVRWLTKRVSAAALAPAPIGLYFASLWYSERLYPIVFALLGLARQRLGAAAGADDAERAA